MIKFRSTMLLSLVTAPSAFAAAVDAMPHIGYFSVPIALIIFSFLVMVRFIFFSERNKKLRKIFLALILFSAIGLYILVYCIESESLYLTLILFGIITAIACLIIVFILIYKKNEFITKPILSILVTDIAIVILIMICNEVYSGTIFIAILGLPALNGILGIISLSRLI